MYMISKETVILQCWRSNTATKILYTGKLKAKSQEWINSFCVVNQKSHKGSQALKPTDKSGGGGTHL